MQSSLGCLPDEESPTSLVFRDVEPLHEHFPMTVDRSNEEIAAWHLGRNESLAEPWLSTRTTMSHFKQQDPQAAIQWIADHPNMDRLLGSIARIDC